MSIRREFKPPMDFGTAGRKNAAQHGTRTGYVNGCRCEPCVLANRLWKRTWAGQVPMEEYLAEQLAGRQKHGAAAYQRGCRCVTCKTAQADRHAPYQSGVTGALDTRCDGCGRMFRGAAGLKIHRGKLCPGPVLERVG